MTQPSVSPVDIWFGSTDAIQIGEDEIDSILTQDEKNRAQRFAFEHLRHHYRLGRAALRKILSTYLDIDPSSVTLSYRRYGKPFVEDGPEFNMSSSGSMLLIGVGGNLALGVDMEQRREMDDMEELVERYYSERERTELVALPNSDRLRGFFRAWSRKEAVTKALGLGLNMKLWSFSVPIDEYDACSLIATSEHFPDSGTWYVRPIQIFEEAESAIAANRPFAIARRFRIGHGLQWAEE